MPQQILFDLDDTLIYCSRYFYRAIDRFSNELVTWFNDPAVTLDAVKDKQSEYDGELIGQSGFKSEHFPQSFLETYSYYSELLGRAVSPIEKDFLWKLGIDVYAHETEPYPYMEDTLQELGRQGHELHLYTGGEQHIQLRKIEDMGLMRYFDDRIYIRQVKNISALDELLTAQAFERSRTWMIGNSIRNDIVPALHAGIHAIHIEVPDEWAYNIIQVDVEPKGQYFSVQSLQEIPSAFARAI